MDPHRLLLLRAVRRAGGVLAAARVLHLTPSGVSQHLSKLEAEVGLPLVDRSRRGGGRTVQFTAVGHALADHAEQIADTLAAAEQELARFTDGQAQPLRIGGFSVVLSELVAPVVMRMALANPGIDLRVWEITEAEGIAALLSGELDLLLSARPGAGEPDRPPELVETDLLRDPYKVVVPRTWPTNTDPAVLLAQRWFTSSLGPSARHTLERMCREHGVSLDAREVGTASATTLLAFVATGLGAAIVPGLTLSQFSSQHIRVSNEIEEPGARMLSVLRRADDGPSNAALFIAELQQFAAGERRQPPQNDLR